MLAMSRSFWSRTIAQSLTCAEGLSPSDLILVENLNQDYLLFERAAELQQEGFGRRVLIPVQVTHDSDRANAVAVGIAELMASVAQVRTPEFMPVQAPEPISLNIAMRIRDFLAKEQLRSMIVVTAGFRSRRSLLIYKAVSPGVHVSCIPVFVRAHRDTWAKTWHGVQEVTEQFLKLQFYRFYVFLKLDSVDPRGPKGK